MIAPVPAKDKLPAPLKSEVARRQLGERIKRTINRIEAERAPLVERWDLQERYYRGLDVDSDSVPWDGASDYTFPVIGPKLRQRRNQLYAAMTSQSPYFRVRRLLDETQATEAEQLLQFNWDTTGFMDSQLGQALDLVMPTNLAVIYASFQDMPGGHSAAQHIGPFAGVIDRVIDPRHFLVWPQGQDQLESAKLHGHFFELRRGEVKALYTAGLYLDELKDEGADSSILEQRAQPSNQDDLSKDWQNDEDPRYTFAHLFWREDLNGDGYEEIYRINIHVNSGTIMSAEAWDKPLSLYAILSIKQETGRTYTEGSPAKDAQTAQLVFDALLNMYLNNNEMAARPPVLTEAWSIDESTQNYAPGEIRPQAALGAAMPIPVRVDNSALPSLLQMVMGIADRATNVSDSLTGGRAGGRESTATEESIKAQAFQISSVDDMVRLSIGMVRLAKIHLMLMQDHLQLMTQRYPNLAEHIGWDGQSDIFTGLYRISLTGKQALDSPNLRFQQVQAMLAMLTAYVDRLPPSVLYDLISAVVEYSSLPDDIKARIKTAVASAAQSAGAVPGPGGPAQQPAMDQLEQLARELEAQGAGPAPQLQPVRAGGSVQAG